MPQIHYSMITWLHFPKFNNIALHKHILVQEMEVISLWEVWVQSPRRIFPLTRLSPRVLILGEKLS